MVEVTDHEAEDSAFNFPNMSYESMRSLVERRDKDLEDLREFADLEREALESHVREQQEIINYHLKRQAETDLVQDKSKKSEQSIQIITAAANKENCSADHNNGQIQLLRVQLAQCKANLHVQHSVAKFDDNISKAVNMLEKSDLKSLRARSAKEVCIMDSIL